MEGQGGKQRRWRWQQEGPLNDSGGQWHHWRQQLAVVMTACCEHLRWFVWEGFGRDLGGVWRLLAVVCTNDPQPEQAGDSALNIVGVSGGGISVWVKLFVFAGSICSLNRIGGGGGSSGWCIHVHDCVCCTCCVVSCVQILCY